MNYHLLIKTALRSLNHHKGRTSLTTLGIIIGIASIIGTLSIGYGAEEKMRQKILSIGNNSIEIWAARSFNQGTTSTKLKPVKRLMVEDITLLRKQCPEIHFITPYLHVQEQTNFMGSSIIGQIKGGNEDFFSVIKRSIKHGKSFSWQQIQQRSLVVVLGARAAKELFKSRNPLGETVMIKNRPFTVIGILNPVENYFGAQDPNLDIFMPYTTLKRAVIHLNSNQIYGILASTKVPEDLPALVNRIRKVMRLKHQLDIDEPDDFTMTDQLSMLKTAKASSSIFNLFLVIISAISLLVGGIGVMNMMLVSVSERTKEIGIRMALGASARMVKRQFMIEAICLCLIGGAIGIILGIIAPLIAHYFTGFPVIIKLNPILISCFIIFFVGILFGFYPAHKASRLNPVDALHDS